MAFAYGRAVVMRSAMVSSHSHAESELRRELIEQFAVRLRIDFLLEHALGARDGQAHDLSAQCVTRPVALEVDLRLGAREGLLALEARGLARFLDDLVRLRARLRF